MFGKSGKLESVPMSTPGSSTPRPILQALTAIAAAGVLHTAAAADLCVKPHGADNCFATIQAAVNAASNHQLSDPIIHVGAGTYRGNVMITEPLALIGADDGRTIINASGEVNGIDVDGQDHPGLAGVTVSNFEVEDAGAEGILVTNAADVTLSDNRVLHNDRSLQPGSPSSCPGLPGWEKNESFDCGEGIHLSGVADSTVRDNVVSHNAGGILLSDDTGATHGNLIVGNIVSNNPYDCGITLASHVAAAGPGSTPQYGVFDNTIAGNLSQKNGLKGQGAGVGLFDAVPGTQTYDNLVIHNRLIGNSLPGVALHSHTPRQKLTDNAIVGNYIAGNARDTGQTSTPGPTGINVFGVSAATGTVIAQNVIRDEAIAIVADSPAQIDVHFNDFGKNESGVDNQGPGTVDATDDWWGCSKGAGAAGCAGVLGAGVTVTPALHRPLLGHRSDVGPVR